MFDINEIFSDDLEIGFIDDWRDESNRSEEQKETMPKKLEDISTDGIDENILHVSDNLTELIHIALKIIAGIH